MSKTGAPRKTLNLDSLRAQRLEADGARDFDLTVGGKTYTVPYTSWLSLAALEALTNASGFAGQLRAILGDDAATELIDAGLTGGDVQAILDEMQAGPSLGESSDSSES